jgi:hypothetical protein
MSNTDKSAVGRAQALRNKTLAVYHKLNPDKKESGDFYIERVVGQIIFKCCDTDTTVVPCSLGEITGFTFSDLLESFGTPYFPEYNVYYNVSWDPLPGATSYTITSNITLDLIIQATPTSTTAIIYLPFSDYGSERVYTITAYTACGNATTSLTVQPCFLAGSLVQMADGTTKPIEDVCVNDLVLGAFGEINTVLALHRPLLGDALMCKINGEHSTTNHHPHISVDRKFYCGNPDLVSQSTYGHVHKVIDADGNIVDRMLHGLKRERIEKLHIGVELKTVEGSRTTQSIETYSMPEDTQLYNLVVGGSHTYHVDGYAVTGWPREDDFDYDKWMIL